MNKMQFHTVESEVCHVHVVLDDIHASQWAMAGAMFSRSNDGILAISEKISAAKAESFMEKFYIGYSHESIGDLVDVKLYVEKIPFYIAAMLEHHTSFRGQESSTRYINFAGQSPSFTADKHLYKQQIEFYLNSLNTVTLGITKSAVDNGLLPEDLKERKVHERAIAARAFDISRGLLPLGATTNIAWHGSIRSIKRHLAWLKNSFRHKRYVTPYVDQILGALRDVYPESVEENPRPTNPWPMSGGEYTIEGKLDFGSWRDLNRHRIGKHKFHLPDASSNFHRWYDKMLAEHGVNVFDRPETQGLDSTYLGQGVRVDYECNEEQFNYVCRLRSKSSVHPTLRMLIAESFNDQYESDGDLDGIDVTPDPGAFGYFLMRGNDTILIKS